MKQRILWIPVALAVVLAASACHDAGTVTVDNSLPPRPAGAYAYVGYDAAGQTIATGWFSVWASADESGALGEWHFRRLAAGVSTHHIFGDGALTPAGGATIPELWIVDLVPYGFMPYPAFAAQEWSIETPAVGPLPDAFSGTWRYLAGGREVESGRFDADRKPAMLE